MIQGSSEYEAKVLLTKLLALDCCCGDVCGGLLQSLQDSAIIISFHILTKSFINLPFFDSE
jgi:hypothetical protein